MHSTLWLLLPIIVLAVLLDIFFVRGLQRYRKLKKEHTDNHGDLKLTRRELLRQAYFPQTHQAKRKPFRFKRTRLRRPIIIAVELSLILLWSFVLGSRYLDMNPLVTPAGNEFGSTIQSHHMWTQFQKCGLCILWNGSVRGGFPAFADIQGSMLHPLVVVTTLLWGVVNGVKISLIVTLWSAGVAQWWIARELKLGWLPRMWSAALAVAGGHLSGRMELGVFGVTLATAMGSLVFAGILHVENKRSQRAAVLLGIMGALTILAGQGYMQVGMIGILPATALLLVDRDRKLVAHWKHFALAAIIGLLLASHLLLPLIHFSPNISKETDAEFHSVQPLQYFVLNLVIDDPEYYRSESLTKFPYPYLYSLYIGWIPVLLAIFGITRIRRDKSRIFGFMLAAIALCFLVASAILLKPFVNVFPSLAGIRHSPQIAGLAVPLIIALSAYGLEKLMHLPWPQLFMYFTKTKATSAAFSLRWLLILPLLFSLKSAYEFSRLWLQTVYREPDVYELLGALKTDTLQWVEPPFGEHAFVEPAVQMGLKLSPGILTWHWRDREFPATFRYLSREGQPEGATCKGEVHGLSIYEKPERSYAELYTAEYKYACPALGSGGNITVVCNAKQPGDLVVQEYAYPGWRVWVDGQPARLVFDENWLTVHAPAGKHAYTFRYLPWDVPVGLLLSFLGIFACFYFWRRRS